MTQKLASLVDESCDEAKRQFTCSWGHLLTNSSAIISFLVNC